MEKYDELLEIYLSEGINYDANTISKAKRCDLEQLAADSYWQGWQDCKANGVKQSAEPALHKHIVIKSVCDHPWKECESVMGDGVLCRKCNTVITQTDIKKWKNE